MKPLPFLAALVLAASAFAEAPVWQPAKTWVFAVGILKFEGAALHGWPEEGRVDVVMLNALRKRGVPEDHILFLKNEQATSGELKKRFAEFLARPGKDGLLIFYYAGHGGRNYRDAARPVHLVPYDAKNGWPAASILEMIEAGFKGSRVLLTADCCHSGGLAEEAARHQGRIGFGTLTSARASATSTGHWTFTQCLADLYSGSPKEDLDHDGAINFAEAAQYADLKMAFGESQRSTGEVTGSFPRDLVFAKDVGPAALTMGERCEGRWDGKWYQAEILSARDGRYRVTWPGWGNSYDSWVNPVDLRPPKQSTFGNGAPVEIQWGKTWYAGNVVRSELGLMLVHYDGYTAADDEWVPPARVRARSKE